MCRTTVCNPPESQPRRPSDSERRQHPCHGKMHCRNRPSSRHRLPANRPLPSECFEEMQHRKVRCASRRRHRQSPHGRSQAQASDPAMRRHALSRHSNAAKMLNKRQKQAAFHPLQVRKQRSRRAPRLCRHQKIFPNICR